MADKSGQNPLKDISFNVEAKHDEKALVSQSSDAPIHVRVKVHNRNDPKVGNNYWLSLPDSKSKILKHSASDQTILSFKLLMQPDLDKNTSRRPRKSFINRFLPGVCLGISNSDDEGPYMPGVPCLDDNNVIIKPGATQTGVNKRQKIKYKPGGCLDPPFGEDRYAYAPANKLPISEENSQNNVQNKGDILIPKYTKSSDEISYKSLGLITYPERAPICNTDKYINPTMSDVPEQKRKISQYSESAEMYFKPTKAKDTEESPADPIKGLNVLGAIGTAADTGLKTLYSENDDEWTAINKPLPTHYNHDLDSKPLEETFDQIILDPGKLVTTGFKTVHDDDTVEQRPDEDINIPSTYTENKSFGSLDKLDANENTDKFQPTQEGLVPTDSFDKYPEIIENITPDVLTTGKYFMSGSEIIKEDRNRGQKNIVTGIIGAISGVLAESQDGKQVPKYANEYNTGSNKIKEYSTKTPDDSEKKTPVGEMIQTPSKKAVSRSRDNQADSISNQTKTEPENVFDFTHVEGQKKIENKSDEFVAAISLRSASSKGQNETAALKEQDGDYSVDILKKSGIGITKSRLDSGSKERLDNTEEYLLDKKLENLVNVPNIRHYIENNKQEDMFVDEIIENKDRDLKSRQESSVSKEHVTDSEIKQGFIHQGSRDVQADIYSSVKNEDNFVTTIRQDKTKGVLSHRGSKDGSKEQSDDENNYCNEKESEHFANEIITEQVKLTQGIQQQSIPKKYYNKEKDDQVGVIQYDQKYTWSTEQLGEIQKCIDYSEEFTANKMSDTQYQNEIAGSKDEDANAKKYWKTKEDEYIDDQSLKDGARSIQSHLESTGRKDQLTAANIYSNENVIGDKVTLQESIGSKEYKNRYNFEEGEDENVPKIKEDFLRITSCDVSYLNVIDDDSYSLNNSKSISSKKELQKTITKPFSESLDDDVIRDSTSLASDVIKTAKPIHISALDVHLGTSVEEDFDSSNFGTSIDMTHITEHDDETIYEHIHLENNLPIIDERVSELDTNAESTYLDMKKDIFLSETKDQTNAKSGNKSIKSYDHNKGAVIDIDKIDNILKGQKPHHPETEKGMQGYTSLKRIASSSIASSNISNSETSINRQHDQIYKYRFDTPQKSSKDSNVKMDIAFKTYMDKNKHIVLRTIDPRTIDANRSENITKKKITSLSEDVEIPISSSNKLLMRLKASTAKVQGDKTTKSNRTMRSSSMNDFSSEEKITEQRNLTAINRCLGVIYEQQLIPLQKTINNLKQELQALTQQQSMLTQKMVHYEKSKAMRISSKNRKCACQHN